MAAHDGRNRRTSMLRRLAVAAGLMWVMSVVSVVSGQPVHRSEIKGKASYSHEPCLDAKTVGVKPAQTAERGAKRIDTVPQQGLRAEPGRDTVKSPAAPPFRCDGRLHCSQMKSCNEAKLFLKHCPGVKMDGDGDGVPCEQQWCTGLTGG
jgi:hypothetical protein